MVDDRVNHPPHYCKGGIECIDAIKASMSPEAFAGYYEEKGGAEDLLKARVYLQWLINEKGLDANV